KQERNRRPREPAGADPAIACPQGEEGERRSEERDLLGPERGQKEQRGGKELPQLVPDARPPAGGRPQRGEEKGAANHVGSPGDEADALGVGRMQREEARAHSRRDRPPRHLPREEPEKEARERVPDQIREMEPGRVSAID